MKKGVVTLLLTGFLMFRSLVFSSEYIMCPGDQLEIVVIGNEDINTTAPATNKYFVRPDGKLSFPLIGEIDTTGLTVSQFTNMMQIKLGEYIVQPHVTVNITQLGTTRVYVLGEVKKPGLYELVKSHNVLDAIGIAEGYTKDAAKKKVFLIHKDHKGEPLKINLNDLLKKGDTSQNYALVEGDLLYLTSNGRIDFARDILPIISVAYMINDINED